MMQDMFMRRDLPEETVQVVSGQAAQVRLEAGEKPIDGPTASLSGTVTVDGKLGAGFGVMVRGKDRQFSARANERGRFDLGTVPAGELSVSLMGNGEGGLFAGPSNTLWNSKVELKQGESRELGIEVMTSSLRGTCTLPDGSPAANVFVQGRGKPKGAQDSVWVGAPTNSNGEFHFPQVAEGTWSLSVRASGEQPARGELKAVEAVGGVPTTGLRIALQAALVVKGTVDLAALGGTKPEWCWIEFGSAGGDGQRSHYSGINMGKGTFQSEELSPGLWNVKLHAQVKDQNEQAIYSCGALNVPAGGLSDVVLRPGAREQASPPERR